jgi:hypothetical protein
MELNINNQIITIPNSAAEAVPVMDLCDTLKTHAPIRIFHDLKICKNCGAILDEDDTLITAHRWDAYRPLLSQIRAIQGGEEYLKMMRSWFLSSKSSGVILSYSVAMDDCSDDIEEAIANYSQKWQYILSLLRSNKQGKARQLMIKNTAMLHRTYRRRYYFEYELMWYNKIAKSVTKRREQLNDRNKAIRDQMKLHKGAERQRLVFELEENIAKRKRLKDVEKAAHARKMEMRGILHV